jgi:tRNA A37 threonylcarbamoyladenosine dehydratase
MADWLERTELLIGSEKIEKLKNAHVLIVGLGGIGSYAAEFIARSGIGMITLIDGDVFDHTNKNRQLTALDSTIGKSKAEILGERIKDINPHIQLTVLHEFVQPDRVYEILKEKKPDVVMDCIDSVSVKIEWIVACLLNRTKIVSHFGAGGKLNPNMIKVGPMPNVINCTLAAHVKKRLKKRNIDTKKVRAVYSEEVQRKDSLKMTNGLQFKKSFYGTISYMPALFGLHGAADVIDYLSNRNNTNFEDL